MKLKWNFGLENIKKLDKTYLLVAALVGILLLVIKIPTEETKQGKTTENTIISTTPAEKGSGENTYCKNLERKLEDILTAMEGVGKVEVMITLHDSGEVVVEKDLTTTQEKTKEEGEGVHRENSTLNSQEKTIYIGEQSQEGTPFVTREVNPQIEGILIVAEGGGNSVVVKNISDAILALFPIEAHKIKVVKMN